jgi:hypothetical protein
VFFEADPYFSKVSLLIKMDGAADSTFFPDLSARRKTLTAYGNAKLSTLKTRFGQSSAYFDGTGDYLSTPHNTDLNLASGDWTIEVFVYLLSNSVYNNIVVKDAVWGSYYPQYQLKISNSGYLQLYLATGTASTGTLYTGATVISTAAWHHVAAVKVGSITKGFVNGVQQWSSAANAMADVGRALYIGAENNGLYSFNGYMDHLRITQGVARYANPFVPPDTSFSEE